MTDKEKLLDDIRRLAQDKSGLSAELEKAESLLKLQTGIEKENAVYFK